MGPDNDRRTAGREVRVMHISSISFAAIVSLCCSVCGLGSGMMQSYTLMRAAAENGRFPDLIPTFVMKDMFLAGVVGFVGRLVIGFLAGGLIAGFYNMAARITGGIRIRISDGEDA